MSDRALHHTGALRLAAAGVAGVAAGVMNAGGAHAAIAPSAPAPSAGTAAHHDAVTKLVAPAAETTTTSVAPDYGTRKLRVGVQITPGADVPDGTDTVGTTITITETGPNAPDPQAMPCQTDASTEESGSTATFCVFQEEVARAQTAKGAAEPASSPAVTAPSDQFYRVAPGDTATITQTTVNKNLQRDTSTMTFGPCDAVGFFCDGSGSDGSGNFTGDQALFNDPGFPPAATDDTATTKINTPVAIDNLANDSLGGAKSGHITDLTQPKHGTVTIVTSTATTPPSSSAAASSTAPPSGTSSSSASGSETVGARFQAAQPLARVVGLPGTNQSLLYTPAKGFVGVDPFTYNLTTANGTSKATVTVTVTGPAPSSPAPSPSSSKAPIAVTGNGSEDELLLALGLLGAGGVFAALGRRRRAARGRHAG